MIDADRIVRTHTVRVEVEVETQDHAGAGWENAARKTFRPEPAQIPWPISFKLDALESKPTPSFNLVATAFDKQGSVVARSQAIREPEQALKSGLKVHFEAACFRQQPLCSDGETCSEGKCVNAREDLPTSISDETDPKEPRGEAATPSEPGNPESGIAREGEPCSGESRACPDHGAQMSLHCEDGTWRAAAACRDDERCDSSSGPNLGTCQPIARECANQKPNVAFCDQDTMRVCTDLVSSAIRPCAENQHCVPGGSEAECGCLPGFVADGALCREATGCGTDRGGCDPLTDCSVIEGGRVCGACPPGYSGTGLKGCAPLLKSLVSSAGSITPEPSPNTFEYRIRVPIVAPTVTLTVAGPDDTTRIAFDAVEVPAGGSWKSPLLRPGETPVQLTLTSKINVSSTYSIVIERSVEQQSIIKTSNPDENDGFAIALAMSGDTFVAGALNEDSAATSVDGSQSNNAAMQAGAAYVFRRGEQGWIQEAYLKGSATEAGDLFGSGVAIDGDTIVVGAPRVYFSMARDPNAKSGVAYVFKRAGGVWTETQRIVPSKADAGDLFGLGVGLSGDQLLIGAMFAAAPNGDRSGIIYAYERSGDKFVEKQILAPRETAGVAGFGSVLSLEKDRFVAGAPYDAARRGAAWVFQRRDGMWVEEQRFVPETLTDAMTFGFRVKIYGEHIAIGAPRVPEQVPPFSPQTPPGEVYLYDFEGAHWKQSAVLRGPPASNSDWYGACVEMTDDVLVVGAYGEAGSSRGVKGDPTRKGAPWSGAVFIYGKVGGAWRLADYLKASNASTNDEFGWTLGLNDEVLVAGAPYEGSGTPGIQSEPGGTSAISGALYMFH